MTSFVSISHNTFLTNIKSAIQDRFTSINMIYFVISRKKAISPNIRCYCLLYEVSRWRQQMFLRDGNSCLLTKKTGWLTSPNPATIVTKDCVIFQHSNFLSGEHVTSNLCLFTFLGGTRQGFAVEVSEHLCQLGCLGSQHQGLPRWQLLHSFRLVSHKHKAVPLFSTWPLFRVLILGEKACNWRHLKTLLHLSNLAS